MACDIGIKDGDVATLGKGLTAGAREIEVTDAGCLPGGIDSHCHMEQHALITKSPRGDTLLA
jgi:dihydropyrimidinase